MPVCVERQMIGSIRSGCSDRKKREVVQALCVLLPTGSGCQVSVQALPLSGLLREDAGCSEEGVEAEVGLFPALLGVV